MKKNQKHNLLSWKHLSKKGKEQPQLKTSIKAIENQVLKQNLKSTINQVSISIESLNKLNQWEKHKNNQSLMQQLPETISQEPIKKELVSQIELEKSTELAENNIKKITVSKDGFFNRLKRSILKTKETLGLSFIWLFRGQRIDSNLFDKLEEKLIIADVGIKTTCKIMTNLTQYTNQKQIQDATVLYDTLKSQMHKMLHNVERQLDVSGKKPYIILVVGVNGVGKTTTIGKLAHRFKAEGKSVILSAGDTFRAAAIEQLKVWGELNHVPVVAQQAGADSASVIFDSIHAAQHRHIDVLMADTAGRLQNKSHLMEELKKIIRVMKKLDMHAPHEIMLILDAGTGQNTINQVKLFNEAIGLTGIALTKLDGTAKGGIIFSIADQFGIPIRYIGIGEELEDLRPFKANDFIEALFAKQDQ